VVLGGIEGGNVGVAIMWHSAVLGSIVAASCGLAASWRLMALAALKGINK